ncbi:MAG: hypothetical protein IT335_11565 [Thermomicrobiales bacterium]|nr:hypothetical protein [Thermomicrobiales bacterium]
MTDIWKEDESGWSLQRPTGFPDEATLHDMVARAPHMLPLAGGPQLAIVGREVVIGAYRADLVGIEPSGRLVIIEIKLAHNAEARRAVVAQILTYAAYLHGESVQALEIEILGAHLATAGYGSLFEAAQTVDQSGSMERSGFESGLGSNLESGRFRLVIVLDQAPPELVKLVGYLEAVSDGLVIDLITVSSYDIDGSRVVIPRRVDPERERVTVVRNADIVVSSTQPKGRWQEIEEFAEEIDALPASEQYELRRLVEWARVLESAGLARLKSWRGIGRMTLLPYLPEVDAGLVTIWNDKGGYLSLWRSVFESRAPEALERFDQSDDLPRIGQGSTVRGVSDELLEALTAAYEEASVRRLISQ